MILEDFHVHTNLCDGKNSAEEMVRAAIDLKMKRIGFSGHAYTPHDLSYCMSKADMAEYYEQILQLKEKYKSKIEILCGLEMDYFSEKPEFETDYVIGSVHYVKKDGRYIDVDLDEESFKKSVSEFYNGDFYSFSADYFELVGNIISKTNADIIGHFDLVTKFNEGAKLFDTNNPEYMKMAEKAIDKVIVSGKPFEINTGAISKGYRSSAYPELFILKYIKEKGGRVILSSDSHSVDTLCYEFEKYEQIAKEIGFTKLNF